jgi:hypothetical protein
MGTEIQEIIAQVTALARVIIPLFAVLGVLSGLAIIASAARMLLVGGSGRFGSGQEDPSLMAVAIKLFIGACLIQFSTSIGWTRDVLAGAGTEVREAMAYVVPAGGNGVWTQVLAACLLWVATIGVAAMYRGFLLWNKAGSGENQGGDGDYFMRGLWHILAGGVCINIGT